ncbi:MAG: hypothetical protein ACFFE5_16555, partial [Candidatus Thorarchaeota archaeon]
PLVVINFEKSEFFSIKKLKVNVVIAPLIQLKSTNKPCKVAMIGLCPATTPVNIAFKHAKIPDKIAIFLTNSFIFSLLSNFPNEITYGIAIILEIINPILAKRPNGSRSKLLIDNAHILYVGVNIREKIYPKIPIKNAKIPSIAPIINKLFRSFIIICLLFIT